MGEQTNIKFQNVKEKKISDVKETDIDVNLSTNEPLVKYDKPAKTESSARTSDDGYGWVVCFACFFINFLVDGLANCFAVHLQEYRDYFQLSVGGTTLANSMLCSTYALSGPIVSLLVNKYGCRVVGFSGSLISALGFLISAFSPNIVMFYLTYGLIAGIGLGMMHLPAVTAVGQYFDKKRSLVMGIMSCGTPVGVLSLVPLAGFLSEHLDWKGSHFIFAGLLLHGCIFYALIRPLNPHNGPTQERFTQSDQFNSGTAIMSTSNNHNSLLSKSLGFLTTNSRKADNVRLHTSDFIAGNSHHSRPPNRKELILNWGSIYDIPERSMLRQPQLNVSAESSSIGKHVTKKKPLCHQLSRVCSSMSQKFDVGLLRNSKMVALLLATLLAMVGYYVPIIFSTSRAIEVGVSDYQAVLLLSIFGICNAVGRLLFGCIASFYKKLSPLLVHNVTIAIAGVAITLTPLCDTFSSIVISILVYGFFFSTYVALGPTIICDTVGADKLTSAYGLLLLTRGLGTILGPPVAGQLCDLTGNYDSTFYMAGGCMLTAVAIYSFLFKRDDKM